MKKMLVGVFLVMAIIIGIVAFLLLIYTPVEKPVRYSQEAVVFQDGIAAGNCQLGLGGTVRSYRLDVRPTRFFTNPYSVEEGLLVDGAQILASVSFGINTEGKPIRFQFNGCTVFTNPSLDYLVVLLPERYGENTILVSPASTEADAREILKPLLEDARMQSTWSADYTRLQTIAP